MVDTGDNEYLLAAQVGRLLHVSPKTVSRWAKEGKLPYVRTLGGHRRFPGARIREIADRLSSATESVSIDEVLSRTPGQG
ncbi:MAG TPA: helix-turn-helix domain-containing protein [Actinomycetota bacterium]|nr:helix-turn-helix domain-containing protein [Actinomycetota bacterium]